MPNTNSTLDCASGLQRPCWKQFIVQPGQRTDTSPRTYTIGTLPGEGIGPEIVAAALQVLGAVTEARSLDFEVVQGGAIGLPAIAQTGQPLTDHVTRFCDNVFACGGAILAGAGGDRFVYDMRRHFNLFCKLNPLVPHPELRSCAVLKSHLLSGIDILVVRDNSGGVYQGEWSEIRPADGVRRGTHLFSYDEAQVNRLVRVAAAIAQQRRGKLTLLLKPNGIPAISQLWIECAEPIATAYGVTLEVLEIDNAVYQLVQSPRSFDVIAAPNLFGDIVADLGGVLLGSRGLCYGVSYSESGAAVYQTNHGAAYDLAGTDQANPIAQILSLSMLLHESFGLAAEAALIESAISEVYRRGYRTFDVMAPGCRLVGTREMAELIAEAVRWISCGQSSHASRSSTH